MAEGQAVAVHRHDGETVAVHFKQGAGVDGAAFVVADGKEGLGDHGLELRLWQNQGVLVFYGRQLGELLGIGAQDVELAHAALDVDHIVFRLEGDDIVGQLADNLAEQACAQHQSAFLPDVGRDNGADASLQVVAGEAEVAAGLQQNPFQSGNGAFGRYCSGCGRDGGL